VNGSGTSRRTNAEVRMQKAEVKGKSEGRVDADFAFFTSAF